MATAGERYSERTGNIWSYAYRQDMTGLRAALQRGVDVNMTNTVGWTPAIAAAAGGRSKALRHLVKHGADLTIADKGGSLPAHHAAKNGHAHSLKVLQELGSDITKVRLSQGKGNAVRDVLKEACKKTGLKLKEGLEEYADIETEEENVGYNRRQAKSTAFWGPRRTPISAKIKKKIIKSKRIKKREKVEVEENIDLSIPVGSSEEVMGEIGYIETVQLVKRTQSKKQRRRQQRQKQKETALGSDEDETDEIVEEDWDDDVGRSLAPSFAALMTLHSDSSDSDQS